MLQWLLLLCLAYFSPWHHPANIAGGAAVIERADYLGNNTTQITNGNEHTWQYQYRSFGDPAKQTLIGIIAPDSSANVAIVRNGMDQPLAITQNGVTRRYAYTSPQYWLKTESHPETGITTYTHDAIGNVKTKKIGSNPATSFTYDGLNRPSTITYPAANGQPASTLVHQYTLTGKVKQTQLTSTGQEGISRRFDYDANQNLTQESLTVGSTSQCDTLKL